MARPPASPPPEARDPDLSIEAPGAREIASVPWPLLLRQRMEARVPEDRRHWVVLATALFGLFTITFTITILAVSIPTIAEDLDTEESTLTWLITGPLLVFAVAGPAVGKLGDRVGHRRVYIAGLIGAAVFAALSVIAWNAASLIAFRVLGATAGAAAGPSSMAMINMSFPPERRAQAMGYWTLVMAGGPVLGVVVGGPVVEQVSWRWIFAAQTPVVILAVVLAGALLPETPRGPRTRFDLAGTILLAASVGAILLALNRGPSAGWSSPVVVAGFVLAPALLAAFVAVERRAHDPLLPLGYLGRRNVSFPLVVQFTNNFAYMGGFILTPLLLQDVLGYGETRTGLLSIARPLSFALSGPIAGYLTVHTGERRSAVFGTAAIVASMVGLSTVGLGTADLFIVGVLALSGIGAGSSLPAMGATIANSVADEDLGVMGAAQQMISQLGAVSGIQILQTVQQAREGAVGAAEAYGDAYLVGGAVATVGMVFAFGVRSGVVERDRAPAAG